MSDADTYLKILDRIVGKRRGDILRSEYERIKGNSNREGYGNRSLIAGAAGYMKLGHEDALKNEERIRAYARRLMERGLGELEGNPDEGVSDFTAVMTGALLYEKIGRGRKVIPKLLEAARNDRHVATTKYEDIRRFIQRNAGEGEKKRGGLENHVNVFIVFTLAGLALSLTSLTLTGHAISGLTATTPGLLGILLFIVGLTGMFFRLRKN